MENMSVDPEAASMSPLPGLVAIECFQDPHMPYSLQELREALLQCVKLGCSHFMHMRALVAA